MEYLLLAVVAGMGQGLAHWFPWKKIIGKPLPRVAAYVVGTVVMITPFGVWLAITGQWTALWGILTVAVASGASVIGAYGIDAAVEHQTMKDVIRKYQDE